MNLHPHFLKKEVEHLFKIIDKLKQRGCGIIYISHKMDEIFKICDEITILRDGKWINTVNVKESTMEQIVGMMVGRELTQRFPEKNQRAKRSDFASRKSYCKKSTLYSKCLF